MKKLLILGGTSFVGRNIVQYLVQQSKFDITLFNRNISNPNLFPTLKKIQGDRNNKEDVGKIFYQHWDYVIDVSCYYPHQLQNILQGKHQNLSNYIFISTCSVYDNEAYQEMYRDEDAPLLTCSKSEETDESLNTYGKRKACCERLLLNSGVPFTILRPALIYGKYDPTDRLYYWLYQVKKEHEILFPEDGKRLFSITYINDFVRIVSSVIEKDIQNQVFNCVSSPTISIASIVDICEKYYQRCVKKVSISASFLLEEGISQWFDIPLWLNSDNYTYSNEKILKLLAFEPLSLEEAIKETIIHFNQRGYPKPKYGIKKAQKQKIIDRWKQKI